MPEKGGSSLPMPSYRLSRGKNRGLSTCCGGSYAQRKASMVDPQRNCILKTVHPSPLSAYRGFSGAVISVRRINTCKVSEGHRSAGSGYERINS